MYHDLFVGARRYCIYFILAEEASFLFGSLARDLLIRNLCLKSLSRDDAYRPSSRRARDAFQSIKSEARRSLQPRPTTSTVLLSPILLLWLACISSISTGTMAHILSAVQGRSIVSSRMHRSTLPVSCSTSAQLVVPIRGLAGLLILLLLEQQRSNMLSIRPSDPYSYLQCCFMTRYNALHRASCINRLHNGLCARHPRIDFRLGQDRDCRILYLSGIQRRALTEHRWYRQSTPASRTPSDGCIGTHRWCRVFGWESQNAASQDSRWFVGGARESKTRGGNEGTWYSTH